jgi:hypothetical protein
MHHSCFSPTGSMETRNGIASGQGHAAGRLLCREPGMLQVGGEGGIRTAPRARRRAVTPNVSEVAGDLRLGSN